MKSILIVFFLFSCNILFSQSIYRGLNFGMSEKDAKSEFKNNKSFYDNVDLGNGFIWRSYHQNFFYSNDSLVGLLFQPKAIFGVGHDGTVSYLEFTRAFFENKNYTVFIESEYWQYPENFKSSYGLVLINPDSTTVVHLYPYKNSITNPSSYFPVMKVLNYSFFMRDFHNRNKILDQKQSNTGF